VETTEGKQKMIAHTNKVALPILASVHRDCGGCDHNADSVRTGLISDFPKTDDAILDSIRQRVANGTKVYVGLSGGKDSVSVCLLLQELGIPFTAVFADTGWEAELTYNYVQWFVTEFKIELVTVNEDGESLPEVIRRKGCFPKKQRRFCTEDLKEKPISAFLRGRQEAGEDIISAAGIRAEESAQRASMQVFNVADKRFNCDTWHPVFTWTYEDVIAMHHRADCKPNPHYLLGAERVGCFPCVFAKKSELRIVSVFQPARIEEIRQMEIDIDRQVREAKGDDYEERNYPTSTMFWASVNGQGRPVLIDDVVAIAWTAATRKEATLLGVEWAGKGGETRADDLGSQIAAAQQRWGYTIATAGMDLGFVESLDAIHADYQHRYRTSKELAAEESKAATAKTQQSLAF